jgi:hypothetical protein
MFGVSINRDAHPSLYDFTDYFKGFDKVDSVRQIFGDKTSEILDNLKVEFSSRRGYMGVNDEDGHVIISIRHLKNSPEKILYLDIIHELVHVRQFMDGQELFEHRWQYVDRPTEIEAYSHAVKEARRIGMNDAEIYEYLKAEFMNEGELNRLAARIGVVAPKE